MNVVIMQPFYLFLRKHFHQVQRADLYIFMDDSQFVKNGHHNRNRIKGVDGYIWLTVPIYQKLGQKIGEVMIDNSRNWTKKHWQSIKQNYSKSQYFKLYAEFFEDFHGALIVGQQCAQQRDKDNRRYNQTERRGAG